MSKDKEGKIIKEGLSSENLKKALSTANLETALNKKPNSSSPQPGQSSGDTSSSKETGKHGD